MYKLRKFTRRNYMSFRTSLLPPVPIMIVICCARAMLPRIISALINLSAIAQLDLVTFSVYVTGRGATAELYVVVRVH